MNSSKHTRLFCPCLMVSVVIIVTRTLLIQRLFCEIIHDIKQAFSTFLNRGPSFNNKSWWRAKFFVVHQNFFKKKIGYNQLFPLFLFENLQLTTFHEFFLDIMIMKSKFFISKLLRILSASNLSLEVLSRILKKTCPRFFEKAAQYFARTLPRMSRVLEKLCIALC